MTPLGSGCVTCSVPDTPRETIEDPKAVVKVLLAFTDADLTSVFLEAAKHRPHLLQMVQLSGTAPSNSEICPGMVEQPVNGLYDIDEAEKQDTKVEVDQSCPKEEKQEEDKEEDKEEDEEDEVTPEICQIQFCSGMAYALEETNSVKINLMRHGKLDKTSTIPWSTTDGSAKAGKNYQESNGLIEFKPDESYKTIEVKLVDNTNWDPTLDFFIYLDAKKVQNATIHRSHVRCRVKILDNDSFPTDKYKEQISSTDPEKVAKGVRSFYAGFLLIEYFKMNWKNPVVRRGSIKCFITDVLENLKLISKLFLNVYLVNKIFMPVLENGEDFNKRGHVRLVFVALGYLLPDILLHYFNYRRNYWKVGGASRKLLQRNLMRTYMSYSADTRSRTPIGEVMLTLFNEIPELVSDGYCKIFPLIRNLMQLVLLLAFQMLAGVVGLGKKPSPFIAIVNVIAFTIFPLVMIPALIIREKTIARLVDCWKRAEGIARTRTLDMLHNFYLIADYYKRDEAAGLFEKEIDDVNSAAAKYAAGNTNTLFIPKFVSVVVTSTWIVVGGLMLMKSDSIDLGLFLASISAFGQMGSSWTAIYNTLLHMQTIFTQLRTITEMMNLPNDEPYLGRFERKCEDESQIRLRKLEKELGEIGSNDLAINKLPIEFHNVSHEFSKGKAVFKSINLTLEQGKLHAISTHRSAGKSLILQLCGRRILPYCKEGSDEFFFLPVHLKIRHVSREPMFVMGSLYYNLTFGVVNPKHDKDAKLERVKAICEQIDIDQDTLDLINDDEDAQVLPWHHMLSASTRHLVNMARGFISNADMLVIHRPFGELGPTAEKRVRIALRNFVEKRGLETDPKLYHHRRPRTCIISVRPDEDVTFADERYFPTEIKKDRLADVSKEFIRLSIRSNISASDLAVATEQSGVKVGL